MASLRPLAPLALIAALLAVSGCGSSGAGSAKRPAADAGSTTAEQPDSQEASSYPVPAGTKHASAAAPGTLDVAYGAASNAEVESELAAVHASEHRAHANTVADLKPVPGGESIGGNGTLPIPANVPGAVQRAIAGANEIADFPYVFGGGHASFIDSAYDCSGSVSYVLAAAGLLSAPEDSTQLESWGAPGPGRYITVYTNPGHAYMYIDGVLYDTAGRSGPYTSRWQVSAADNEGFMARHWPGL
ncbi:MAG TPA: hypothetical protein VMA83_05325 [Solirubrobacteraceae bacterium]|nr:hypothetical protein [Solirubrobacteraceae bacterium]